MGYESAPETTAPMGNYFAEDIRSFNDISNALRGIYHQGCNVHAGDAYIPGKIPELLGIANKILMTCDEDIKRIATKSLAEIKVDLTTTIGVYALDLSGYKYGDTPKAVHEILSIIESQFNRSSGEVGNYASGQGTKVWAVTLALAMNLLNDPSLSETTKLNVVNHLIDQSIEGMLTQGGCIQGFVNRGFIALMNMVSYHFPRQD